MRSYRTIRRTLAWATLGVLALSIGYALWIGVVNWSEIMV